MPRKYSNRLNGKWHVGICPKTGKRQFETREDAGKDAKRVRKIRGPRIKPYQCRHCPFWHNGHNRTIKARQYREDQKKRVDNRLNKSNS